MRGGGQGWPVEAGRFLQGLEGTTGGLCVKLVAALSALSRRQPPDVNPCLTFEPNRALIP